jgi:hypothetical protein
MIEDSPLLAVHDCLFYIAAGRLPHPSTELNMKTLRERV